MYIFCFLAGASLEGERASDLERTGYLQNPQGVFLGVERAKELHAGFDQQIVVFL